MLNRNKLGGNYVHRNLYIEKLILFENIKQIVIITNFFGGGSNIVSSLFADVKSLLKVYLQEL